MKITNNVKVPPVDNMKKLNNQVQFYLTQQYMKITNNVKGILFPIKNEYQSDVKTYCFFCLKPVISFQNVLVVIDN